MANRALSKFITLLGILAMSSACIPTSVQDENKIIAVPDKATVKIITTDGYSFSSGWVNPDWLEIPQQGWTRTEIIHASTQMRAAYPVEVNVVVQGLLHHCEQIQAIYDQQHDGLFSLAVFSGKEGGKDDCPVEKFEIMVPLDLSFARSGFYHVEVNSQVTWFELLVDNQL